MSDPPRSTTGGALLYGLPGTKSIGLNSILGSMCAKWDCRAGLLVSQCTVHFFTSLISWKLKCFPHCILWMLISLISLASLQPHSQCTGYMQCVIINERQMITHPISSGSTAFALRHTTFFYVSAFTLVPRQARAVILSRNIRGTLESAAFVKIQQ